ncbi:MAG: arsenate reductase ArsC [Betaproteobacteria bacterium]
MHNVLFIDVRNASRSIMAEAITNNLAIGKGRFRAFSAGSHPADELNRHALEQIRYAGLTSFGLLTKNWNEFAVAGAPVMDFVFTVCDEPLLQAAPAWPGNPIVAIWSLADPGSIIGNEAEIRRAYSRAFIYLYNRINIFASLPLENLDRGGLQRRIDEFNQDN